MEDKVDLSNVSTLALQAEILRRDIAVKESELNRLKHTLSKLEEVLNKETK